ncbi:MAG: T9SS type A sorting domain-containing protein [Candidatus Kapaibacterium sp.]
MLSGSSGGSLNGGVWRRPLSDFGISSVSPQPQPLSQNIYSYPNPFSESTEIVFNSQTSGYADVSIVNILGAPVAHLFSGELGAGNHSFSWDAARMAAPRGSYWCIVRMGGRAERVALSRQ